MGGETSKTAEIANKVSKEIFKWFKWERLELLDQNFNCVKQEKHSPTKKSQHTHPVDVVFRYDDPYLDHSVVLNTDLKSYSKSSIQPVNIRAALKSLAHTIDCAKVSEEWKTRYDPAGMSEVRALLFVYNHDNEYDRDFINHIDSDKSRKPESDDEVPVNLESLPIDSKQVIHIIEPRTIAYLTTVISDIHRLHTEGSFPFKNYFFFYPDLKLHRTRVDQYKRPATIELLCGPFFIVGHDEVKKNDETTDTLVKTYDSGYVIFYNRAGDSLEEFMYLFDVLSSYQLLDGDKIIRIRVAHFSPHQDIRSRFKAAIEMYIVDWGFDEYKRDLLNSIEFEIIEIQKTSFSKVDLGWERKEVKK